MRKISKLKEELNTRDFGDGDEDFYTLDGFVYNSKEGTLSYDNDLDETLPSLLIGVKNPNEADRRESRPRRKFYFPRQAKKYQIQNIQFWIKRKENLSEVLSRWPQLSVRIRGLGRSSAKDLISFLVYLNSQDIKLLSLPGGEEISEIIIHKCKVHLLEGEWRYLASLLQLVNAPRLLNERIEERLSHRSIYGNYIPRGKQIYEEILKIELTCFPVNYSNRKRGHRDSHSGNSVQVTKNEYSEKIGTLETTRDLKILSGKELILQYLYGYTAPVMKIKLSSLESEYRRRLNQQRKEKQKRERKRSQSLTSEVRIIRPKNLK